MLAMQYSFALPASFAMAEIRERIATKGPLLDDFPGLVFKAYLYAERGADGPENLYAPFYLWQDADAMNRFLSGPGFVALTESFGWPAVRLWSVWHARPPADRRAAAFATREVVPLAPHTDLASARESARAHVDALVDQHGAVAALSAYEPMTWTQVRFALWPSTPAPAAPGQRYRVGHVSAPVRG